MSSSASAQKEASFLQAATPTGELLYPGEPHRFNARDITQLLVWAAKNGSSDVSIQTDERVFMEVYGKMHKVTKRSLSNQEILELLVGLYESETAKKEISDIKAMDFAFTARPEKNDRYRFRINATPLLTDGQRGVQITARTIPTLPPSIDEIGLEEAIRQNMAPKQGLVLVTGATGSGKSTLLAAIIRALCEDPDGHRKILTYEAPIEYVYDEVEKPSTLISQHEIGLHLPNWVEAVRNALRRKPDIILMGESRDAETIRETIKASITGHLVYTTVHTNGFSSTIPRMVNEFSKEERNAFANDLLSALRVCVSQRLVPAKNGKRVALREFVVFNDDIVEEIMSAGMDNIELSCRRVLRKYGRSFLQDAQDKFDQGLIDEHVLAEFRRGARAEDLDAVSSVKEKTESLKRARAFEAVLGDVSVDGGDL